MSFNEIKSLFDENPGLIYLVPVVFLVFCTLLWLSVRSVQKNKDTNKIRIIIKNISTNYVKDIALPDGLGGYVFIDYMILTPTGILVVNVQNYTGFIFGGENIDDWTQMIGRKSYKFKNPLSIIQHHIQSVKTHSGTVPVQGRIVFSSAGEFPKGIPKGVSTADSFKEDVSFVVVGSSVPELFQQTWKDILAIVKDSNKKIEH